MGNGGICGAGRFAGMQAIGGGTKLLVNDDFEKPGRLLTTGCSAVLEIPCCTTLFILSKVASSLTFFAY
jgi:hypothetical protein